MSKTVTTVASVDLVSPATNSMRLEYIGKPGDSDALADWLTNVALRVRNGDYDYVYGENA